MPRPRHRFSEIVIRGAILACLLVCVSLPAHAQIGSDRYSSIVIEAATGNVLSAVNPDEPRYPASLTKMMTLYMVFEALRDRRITLDEYVPVSPQAASMSPSKLGLLPGTRITVEQAILGLVTKSANDAAAALGEMLGGDEERFGEMMTLRARGLGMSRTVFRNASGLPDPEQVTTARDLATLGQHLVRDFPDEYHYFGTPTFAWHGRTVFNHQTMLQTYPGADGIKTGYIVASGHNMVTSAVRSDIRLIGVVMGAASNAERDLHMTALLDQAFERLDVAPMPHVARILPALLPSAHAAQPMPRRLPTRWIIQVGAFTSETAARQAATAAQRVADDGDVRIEPATIRGHTAYRAQIIGLSQTEAQLACSALSRRRMACAPIRTENGATLALH